MDKISYALGLSIGNNFQNSGINNLQVEDFVKGLKDVLNGAEPEISYDEAKQVINDFFMNLQKEKLELNKKAGEEFLNINKGKAGVVTLASGLQYQVLKQGEACQTDSYRQGEMSLSRYIDQRYSIRQLRTAWRTRRVRCVAGNPRMG